MTNSVFGFLVVDVTADNAVEITPADDETEDYTTFVNAFDIIAHPRDSIGDARVDSHCSKEGACILHMRISGAWSQSQRKIAEKRRFILPRSIEKPATPKKAMQILHNPRCRVRSAMKPTVMVTAAATA